MKANLSIAFKPEVFAREEEKMKRKKLARLQNLAASSTTRSFPTNDLHV